MILISKTLINPEFNVEFSVNKTFDGRVFAKNLVLTKY